MNQPEHVKILINLIHELLKETDVALQQINSIPDSCAAEIRQQWRSRVESKQDVLYVLLERYEEAMDQTFADNLETESKRYESINI